MNDVAGAKNRNKRGQLQNYTKEYHLEPCATARKWTMLVRGGLADRGTVNWSRPALDK